LACRIVVSSDMVVDTGGSVAGGKESFGTEKAQEPRCRLETLQIPAPELKTQKAAHRRLTESLGSPLRLSLSALRSLSKCTSRHQTCRLTAAIVEDTLVALGRRGPFLGAAVDIGTTTVAAGIVDLPEGRVLQAASAWNRQAAYGLDVVSRIDFVMKHKDGLERLTAAVRGTLSEVIQTACRACSIPPRRIVALSIVGNPTMVHILLGLRPEGLARAPYVGVTDEELILRGMDLKLPVHPEASVLILPAVASNVGADITAGMLIMPDPPPGKCNVMVDLGTNAEIVLACSNGRYACSTAAGPAFEGGSISCGMRAAPGAVDKVDLAESGDLQLHVLGGTEPRGICGTGLIDLVAALLEAGAVDRTGRLLPPEELPETVPQSLRSRIKRSGSTTVVDLNGPQVSASDIRQLQLAKGAVCSGIRTLLEVSNMGPDRVEGIFIAGAFGTFVRAESVRRIGLVPPEIRGAVDSMGNAAGRGARLALLCRRAQKKAVELAEGTRYVELAAHPKWRNIFAESLYFPERDPGGALK